MNKNISVTNESLLSYINVPFLGRRKRLCQVVKIQPERRKSDCKGSVEQKDVENY